MTDDSSPDADGRHSVTAFFEDQAHADKARADLLAAGFTADDILVRSNEASAVRTASTEHNEGIFRSLLDIFVFMPAPDQLTYAEALRRGGVALALRTTPHDYERAIDILDRDGAVNLDEREVEWKTEGWAPPAATPRQGDPGSVEQAGFEQDNRHDPLINPEANQDVRERIGTGTADMTVGTDLEPDSAATTAAAGRDRPVLRDTSHGRSRVRSYIGSAEAAPRGIDPQI